MSRAWRGKDLLPINIFKSLDKIIAKVLVDRLRRVLISIVSNPRVAFIAGRQIMDQILVANEAIKDGKSRN